MNENYEPKTKGPNQNSIHKLFLQPANIDDIDFHDMVSGWHVQSDIKTAYNKWKKVPIENTTRMEPKIMKHMSFCFAWPMKWTSYWNTIWYLCTRKRKITTNEKWIKKRDSVVLILKYA